MGGWGLVEREDVHWGTSFLHGPPPWQALGPTVVTFLMGGHAWRCAMLCGLGTKLPHCLEGTAC